MTEKIPGQQKAPFRCVPPCKGIIADDMLEDSLLPSLQRLHQKQRVGQGRGLFVADIQFAAELVAIVEAHVRDHSPLAVGTGDRLAVEPVLR
ncbi:MAG TPA: hypothetical protein VF689_07030 [Allosphingosinicella sp.]